MGPVITGGTVPGSGDVTGQSGPDCPGAAGVCGSGPQAGHPCGCDADCGAGNTCGRSEVIQVFECTGSPPACFHTAPPDQLIGMCQKCASGSFNCPLFSGATLQPGEIIYAADACFDPERFGPDVVVPRPNAVPALSPDLLLALAAVLAGVGFLGLRGLRRRG